MKFLLLTLFLSISGIGFAQSPIEEVQATINKLFKAMQDADSMAVTSLFMPKAIMQTIVSGKDGHNFVREDSLQRFASSVAKQKRGTLNEVIEFDVIKIDIPLAFVWTPYRFYYNGNFSHSGVNAFCLIQTLDGWKIQYLIDTRKKSMQFK